ncbi:MAG: hypothetical protein HYV07_11680 [Deltaproteobacteria bacterium]|nr:hypothetical protein [Deltaproteobacteria bacterium]
MSCVRSRLRPVRCATWCLTIALGCSSGPLFILAPDPSELEIVAVVDPDGALSYGGVLTGESRVFATEGSTILTWRARRSDLRDEDGRPMDDAALAALVVTIGPSGAEEGCGRCRAPRGRSPTIFLPGDECPPPLEAMRRAFRVTPDELREEAAEELFEVVRLRRPGECGCTMSSPAKPELEVCPLLPRSAPFGAVGALPASDREGNLGFFTEGYALSLPKRGAPGLAAVRPAVRTTWVTGPAPDGSGLIMIGSRNRSSNRYPVFRLDPETSRLDPLQELVGLEPAGMTSPEPGSLRIVGRIEDVDVHDGPGVYSCNGLAEGLICAREPLSSGSCTIPKAHRLHDSIGIENGLEIGVATEGHIFVRSGAPPTWRCAPSSEGLTVGGERLDRSLGLAAIGARVFILFATSSGARLASLLVDSGGEIGPITEVTLPDSPLAILPVRTPGRVLVRTRSGVSAVDSEGLVRESLEFHDVFPGASSGSSVFGLTDGGAVVVEPSGRVLVRSSTSAAMSVRYGSSDHASEPVRALLEHEGATFAWVGHQPPTRVEQTAPGCSGLEVSTLLESEWPALPGDRPIALSFDSRENRFVALVGRGDAVLEWRFAEGGPVDELGPLEASSTGSGQASDVDSATEVSPGRILVLKAGRPFELAGHELVAVSESFDDPMTPALETSPIDPVFRRVEARGRVSWLVGEGVVGRLEAFDDLPLEIEAHWLDSLVSSALAESNARSEPATFRGLSVGCEDRILLGGSQSLIGQDDRDPELFELDLSGTCAGVEGPAVCKLDLLTPEDLHPNDEPLLAIAGSSSSPVFVYSRGTIEGRTEILKPPFAEVVEAEGRQGPILLGGPAGRVAAVLRR